MRRLKCGPTNWHVIARGARRLNLYRDAEDYQRFLQILIYALAKSGCLLWGLALMSNHYHMVLFGSSEQLTACMRRVDLMYSRYHNRKYRLTGHAFEGPFHAGRVSNALLLMWTLAYVFCNPVVAGLVDRPEDYRWSSYRDFVGLPGSAIVTQASDLMKQMDADPSKAWRRFHEALRREINRPKRKQSAVPTRLEVHCQQFEWLMEHAKENAAGLCGEDPTVVAMWWARQIGVTPTAIAKVLGVERSAQVRLVLHRFNKRMAKDRELQEKLALS